MESPAYKALKRRGVGRKLLEADKQIAKGVALVSPLFRPGQLRPQMLETLGAGMTAYTMPVIGALAREGERAGLGPRARLRKSVPNLAPKA